MSFNVVAHLNFRDQARAALTFYHAIFGGEITLVSYDDMHAAQHPADGPHVMWGQVKAADGFCIMGYDVQTERPFERGERSFYVALRGQSADETRQRWAGLADGGVILQPLEPAPFAELYGMLTDRFGITWIVDVAGEHAAG